MNYSFLKYFLAKCISSVLIVVLMTTPSLAQLANPGIESSAGANQSPNFLQGQSGQYPQGQSGQYPQGQSGQYPQGQSGQYPQGQSNVFSNTQALQQSLQSGYVQPRPFSYPKILAPTDFEKYVESITGQKVQRFGADLTRDGDQTFSPSSSAAVPKDYIISSGDEIYVRVWGSVDGDLRVVVDRQGDISIPKIGAVRVGGITFGSLNRAIEGAIGRTISGATVETSLGRMGGIRVFVTGYAEVPGAYTVNNLSSLGNVVMAAGGPSQAGSFRNIELIRNGKVISKFDLYDLLLKGNKSGDLPVTAGDVINIGPAGGFVAVMGSVNKKAIFEIKPGEKVQEILGFAGGFASGSVTKSLSYMSLSGRRQGFRELATDQFNTQAAKDGDIYYAASQAQMTQPITEQNRLVMVDGEVNKPGLYLMAPNQTLQDAIMAAGGFTSTAYLYGTKVERITVKQEQTKAIERFKSEARKLVANDSLRKQTTAEDAQLAAAYRDRIQSVLAALNEIKPEGRLALGLNFDSKELPPALVETGDMITVPSVPNNVTLVGSIPSGQITLAYSPNKNLGDYVNMSGGYNRGADSSQTYVMRASGQFTSATSSWFASVNSLPVYPGDTVFIPEEMQKTTWMKELKDWATIFYQLGLGVAAIKILRQ